MSHYRRWARAPFEWLASFGSVRNQYQSVHSIAYIVQRRRIFEEYEIDVVIDVGANVGQFGRQLRAFFSGEIISFEPVSESFRELQNVAQKDPRWRCYQIALGAEESRQEINVASQSVFSSFRETNAYCASHFGAAATDVQKEQVQVRRLDDVIDELLPDANRRRIFLKMDTQGYDLEVAKGATKTLPRIRALQSEIALLPIYAGLPHWSECIAFYERAGFHVAGLFPNNVDRCRALELDCLMVRAS